jgi:signal transduction histidine kinase/ActR/RegA family two-component response regulator
LAGTEPAGAAAPATFGDLLPALLADPDVALAAVDADRVIRGWSEGARKLLGRAPEDVIGREVDLILPESVRPELGRRLAGPEGPESGDWRVEVPGPGAQPILCTIRILRASDLAAGCVLLFLDRRGDAPPDRRLRWARSLLAVLGDATLVLDPGGRIRELGRGWRTVPPDEPAAWVGRHVGDLFETGRHEVLAALREAAREGRWSGRLRTGGESVSLALQPVRDDAGNLEAFVGARRSAAGVDVGDLFRAAPLGMLLLDPELRIREANEELRNLCGDGLPDPVAGLDARSLALFQVQEVQAALDGLLEGRAFDLPEVRLAAARDRIPPVQLRGQPLAGDPGRGGGHVVMLLPRSGSSDVERQLLRAQKMESIGNFASGLAHDFGNFVAVILGKAGVLRVKLPDDPHITRDLADIETAAKRAQHLAQELMKFARGGRNRVARLDVNRLIEEVGSLIRTSIGKRISLEIRLGADLPPVDGDEVELQQLVLNLCLNARDAMPHGGRLTIETRALTDDQRRRLAEGAAAADGMSLVVRDTGAGMPPEILERIFEPFFTTKHEGNKGAGLGLAMVYGIVRRHGGAIDVKSRVGVGTAFEILLPAAGASRTEQENAKITLVVDDEPAFGEMVQLVLEEEGHRVRLATNGIDALRTIREELGSLAVVILDLRMPGVDGLAVLEELRELAPQLPVLVTTGYAGPEEKTQALARGARKVLEKPYRVADLKNALGEILAPRGAADAAAPGGADPRPSGEVPLP